MLKWRELIDGGGAFLVDHDDAGHLTFLGRPVFVDPNLNGAGSDLAASDVAAAFGDWSAMWVRVSPLHLRVDNGGPDFAKFITRIALAVWIDSAIVDPLALRKLVMKAN
jgi:HK97 family phage major capsid protein